MSIFGKNRRSGKPLKGSKGKTPKHHEAGDVSHADSEYLAISAAQRQKLSKEASKKGDPSLNGCFIPTAEGHYTRMTTAISDKPKTSLTEDGAGRFVMINPQSTKMSKGPSSGSSEKK